MQVPAITDDQLKFPPPEVSKLTPDDFQNVTFVAAVPPDKLVSIPGVEADLMEVRELVGHPRHRVISSAEPFMQRSVGDR
jgi:hypothetical protein